MFSEWNYHVINELSHLFCVCACMRFQRFDSSILPLSGMLFVTNLSNAQNSNPLPPNISLHVIQTLFHCSFSCQLFSQFRCGVNFSACVQSLCYKQFRRNEKFSLFIFAEWKSWHLKGKRPSRRFKSQQRMKCTQWKLKCYGKSERKLSSKSRYRLSPNLITIDFSFNGLFWRIFFCFHQHWIISTNYN